MEVKRNTSTEPVSGWAVIGDLVGSRQAPSRAETQAAMLAAFGRVNELVPAIQPLTATIGDEFQAMFANRKSALVATLAVRLALPEPMDARFGIAHGNYEVVGASSYGLTQDGPAWWDARAAIDEVKRRESRLTGIRTWLHEGGLVNAYTLTRDQLVSDFTGRQRRLLLGLIDSQTQAEMAQREQISASAVSQAVRRSGALAILDGLELID